MREYESDAEIRLACVAICARPNCRAFKKRQMLSKPVESPTETLATQAKIGLITGYRTFNTEPPRVSQCARDSPISVVHKNIACSGGKAAQKKNITQETKNEGKVFPRADPKCLEQANKNTLFSPPTGKMISS